MTPKEFFSSQREKPERGLYIVTFAEPSIASVILKWIPSAGKWYAQDSIHCWMECGYLDCIRPPGFADEQKVIFITPLNKHE